MNARVISLLLILASLILPLMARAADSPPPRSDEDVSQRLKFIHDHLETEARRARIWSWGWAGGMGLLTVGQAAILPFTDNEGDRIDLYFGIGSAAFGVVAIAALPLRVMSDEDFVHERIDNTASSQERLQLLSDAEERLALSAENEEIGRSVWAHVGNVVFNVGIGLGMGFGYDRWSSAAIATGAGIAIGELVILTQPGRLRQVQRDYLNGDYRAQSSRSNFAWSVAPVVAPGNYGMATRFEF